MVLVDVAVAAALQTVKQTWFVADTLVSFYKVPWLASMQLDFAGRQVGLASAQPHWIVHWMAAHEGAALSQLLNWGAFHC